jgi:hypothetical protein
VFDWAAGKHYIGPRQEWTRSVDTEAPRMSQQRTLAEDRRPSQRSLYDRIHDRFAALGGVDPVLPPREPDRDPPDFD